MSTASPEVTRAGGPGAADYRSTVVRRSTADVLIVGYMLSRGFAKSGSRDPHTESR